MNIVVYTQFKNRSATWQRIKNLGLQAKRARPLISNQDSDRNDRERVLIGFMWRKRHNHLWHSKQSKISKKVENRHYRNCHHCQRPILKSGVNSCVLKLLLKRTLDTITVSVNIFLMPECFLLKCLEIPGRSSWWGLCDTNGCRIVNVWPTLETLDFNQVTTLGIFQTQV